LETKDETLYVINPIADKYAKTKLENDPSNEIAKVKYLQNKTKLITSKKLGDDLNCSKITTNNAIAADGVEGDGDEQRYQPPVLSMCGDGPLYFVPEEISGEQKWPRGIFLHESDAKLTHSSEYEKLKDVLKVKYNLVLPQSPLLMSYFVDEEREDELHDEKSANMDVAPISTSLMNDASKSSEKSPSPLDGPKPRNDNRSIIDTRYLAMGKAQTAMTKRAHDYWINYCCLNNNNRRLPNDITIETTSLLPGTCHLKQPTLIESYFVTEPVEFRIGPYRYSKWK